MSIHFGQASVSKSESGKIVVSSRLCGGGRIGQNVNVFRVTGFDERLKPTGPGTRCVEDLNKSKTGGYFRFKLPGDGYYIVTGYPRSHGNLSKHDTLVIVQNGDVEVIEDVEDAEDILQSALPKAYADSCERAARLKAAADELEDRKRAAKEEFLALFPSAWGIYTPMDRGDLLIEASGNRADCGHPFSVRDKPEAAAKKFRQEMEGQKPCGHCEYLAVQERRRREAEEARQAQAKLPALKGSRKQVDWALRIRAAFIAKFGDAGETIKKEKSANFWIDHHKNLAR